MHWAVLVADLRLRANKMTGTIPQEQFFPLKNLEILHLDTNSFQGSIPDIWEHTRRLSEIRLENNQLTSTIPSTMGELKGLSKFFVLGAE
jgi:Leucine-rich repeat (LRR) protein